MDWFFTKVSALIQQHALLQSTAQVVLSTRNWERLALQRAKILMHHLHARTQMWKDASVQMGWFYLKTSVSKLKLAHHPSSVPEAQNTRSLAQPALLAATTRRLQSPASWRMWKDASVPMVSCGSKVNALHQTSAHLHPHHHHRRLRVNVWYQDARRPWLQKVRKTNRRILYYGLNYQTA